MEPEPTCQNFPFRGKVILSPYLPMSDFCIYPHLGIYLFISCSGVGAAQGLEGLILVKNTLREPWFKILPAPAQHRTRDQYRNWLVSFQAHAPVWGESPVEWGRPGGSLTWANKITFSNFTQEREITNLVVLAMTRTWNTEFYASTSQINSNARTTDENLIFKPWTSQLGPSRWSHQAISFGTSKQLIFLYNNSVHQLIHYKQFTNSGCLHFLPYEIKYTKCRASPKNIQLFKCFVWS
jgi:hypothetical protein